jgi:hypothetical protein
MKSKKWHLFLLLFSLSSCHSFYSDYAEGDLYRIPLIDPYRLINIYGADENGPSNHPKLWFLNLYYAGDTTHKGYRQIVAQEINVVHGIIFGHDPPFISDGKLMDLDYYFAIIPAQKIENVFRSKIQWENYLMNRKVDPKKLYYVWDLFRQFKDHGTLPWYNPKENIYP